MQCNRRDFLKHALTTVVWIGAGNTIEAVAGNNFVLPGKSKVKLRVAIASDGHFGQPETDYLGRHAQMVSWINREKADRGVDFTFINGDLYHDETSLLGPVKQQWDKLSMPYYVSHGNHDRAEEETWIKTWNNGWHYGFEKKGIGFVVLNTADSKGTYISPEIDKTRSLLKQYEKHKQLFVFMHITPVKWTQHGIDGREVVDLFDKQSNLKAVFNGHDHDQDNVKENNGKHYFFDSHIAGNWGTNYYGYRILEVMKNGDVLTYQVNPEKKENVNSNQL
jgi:hypothetical protein